MNSNIMISHNWSVALNDIYELIDAQKQQSPLLEEQIVLLEFQLELLKLGELTKELECCSLSSNSKVQYFNRRVLLLKRQVSDIYSIKTWGKTILIQAIEAEITQLLSRIVIEIEENSRP